MTELLVALAFEGLGIMGIIGSLTLGLHNISNPGAGFWPFVVSTILSLLALPVIISSLSSLKNLHREGLGKGVPINFSVLRQVVVIVALILGFAVVIDILGSVISLFVLSSGLFWIANPRRMLYSAAMAVSFTVVAYILFVILLQVPLPMGIWR